IRCEAQFLSRLPATQSLRLHIVLPLRDQAGLDKLLQEISDPSSPSYRHFLTVSEFTAQFGPSEEDYDALTGYATSNGFQVVGGSLGDLHKRPAPLGTRGPAGGHLE